MKCVLASACAICLWSANAHAQTPGEGATDIVRYYGPRTAQIQMIGERFSGKIDVVIQGSGFLVDDRHIVTNDHVVPETGDDFRRTTINVRFVHRKDDPVAARVVVRDKVNDLALLELVTPRTPSPYCPVSALMPPAVLAQGSYLFVMGYPLNRDLRVAPGLMGSPDDGNLLQTDAPLNPGNSGGPVFSSKGYLVAIAVGGVTQMELPDGTTIPVAGINDLIPMSRLPASPVGQWLKANSTSACWHERTSYPSDDQFAWMPDVAIATPTPPPNPTAAISPALPVAPMGPTNLSGLPAQLITEYQISPATLTRSSAKTSVLPTPNVSGPPPPAAVDVDHSVSETKDDHALTSNTAPYAKVFAAEPGYLINECSYELLSAAHYADVSCEVAADRTSAVLRFKLTSGPLYDQWRGWLRATVSLNQQRAALTPGELPPIRKTMRRAISQYQTDHGIGVKTKSYEVTYQTEPGYRLVECNFEGTSVNNAKGVACTIDSSQTSATFRFQLRSGPIFDQWRGWLNGNIVLIMASAPAQENGSPR
ncbi:S1 family peptidase [Sphingomonas mali]|uniref:S1 family peptidase n=1 Tax=Sphingomonas mali TaxID=40682 RepID=UPI00082DEB1C|nr:serine protease [Sphingomonas mali]